MTYNPDNYVVIRDTREKENRGWVFSSSNKLQVETVDRSLKTGDYTIEGLEKVLCVERKATTAEIAKNISEKRFQKALDRMAAFKYRFIICEFDFDDVMSFPVNSGIPKSKWSELKVKNYYIKRCLFEYAVARNIHVIFAGQYGREVAMTIFKRVIENET